MGFLHLGWESATFEDEGLCKPLAELSPLWAAVGQVVDLSRPGLPTVQRVLGWHPLHVAAMSGGWAWGGGPRGGGYVWWLVVCCCCRRPAGCFEGHVMLCAAVPSRGANELMLTPPLLPSCCCCPSTLRAFPAAAPQETLS